MTDVRLAWRGWRRRPLHPIAVVLLLTIGIAGNAVVFNGVERLLISPLAVDRPETLVSFGRLSYPNYRSFVDRLDGVEGVAAFINRSMTLTADLPEPVEGAFVTANYFEVLGVRAIRGRTFDFDPADPARSTDARTAVISERFWRTAHAADPAVVGRTLWLNDVAVTIVGVAPAAFRGITLDYVPDVWAPLALQPEVRPDLVNLRENRLNPWVTVFARRSDDTPPARLRLALTRLVDALIAEYPRDNDLPHFRNIAIAPLARTAFEPDRRESLVQGLGLLQLAVAAVFLIGLVNVTFLVLATGESRRGEFAVRLMQGARWWRIARQQAVEHLLLGGLAGACSLAAARGALALLARLGIVPPLTAGPWTFAVVAGLALAAPIAAGGLTVVRVRRIETAGAIHPMAAPPGATTRSALMHTFLAIQVALSLALVCGALVLVQNLQHRLRTDHGFDPAGVLSARLPLRQAGYTETTTPVFRRALVREVAALPGVRAASWASFVPFEGFRFVNEVAPGDGSQEPRTVLANDVDRRFFAALGIPVVRGRGFSQDERWRREVVVSQRLAATLWPGRDPIRQRLHSVSYNTTYEVVGVVGDHRYRYLDPDEVRYRNLGAGMEPIVYFPPDDTTPSGHLLVRTDLPAASMTAAVRARIRALDPGVLTHNVRTLDDFVDAVLSQDRRAAAGVGAFGVVGLVLVGLGLYGAAARLVGLRRREIGVRLALGARPRDVVQLLLADGVRMMAWGAAAGAGIAVGGWRLAGSRIEGLDTTGAVGLLGLSLLILGAAGVLSILVPARRALRVDPAMTLRPE